MADPTSSILDTTKRVLGISPADTAFDTDIIVHINSVFMTLNQLGVGPAETFSITDNTTTWSDFLSDDLATYGTVISYIGLKVRLLFDPPQTSFVLDSYKSIIAEMEWRLNVQVPIPVPAPPPAEE